MSPLPLSLSDDARDLEQPKTKVKRAYKKEPRGSLELTSASRTDSRSQHSRDTSLRRRRLKLDPDMMKMAMMMMAAMVTVVIMDVSGRPTEIDWGHPMDDIVSPWDPDDDEYDWTAATPRFIHPDWEGISGWNNPIRAPETPGWNNPNWAPENLGWNYPSWERERPQAFPFYSWYYAVYDLFYTMKAWFRDTEI
ncbi:uncharacterized protein LOC144020478 [Festucalex cinctus]